MIERCNKSSQKFVGTIDKLHKGMPAPPSDDFDINAPDVLCNREYLSETAEGAFWKLGYSQKSIIHDDIKTKKYCIAGNTRLPANYAAGVLDDIRVRTIVLDDNSKRGAVAFCCVD